MKNIYTKSALVIFLIVFIASYSNAQFEQKLTINASGSFVIADITGIDNMYGGGLGFDGGIQYNLNRTLSIIGNARFHYNFGSNEYPESYLDNLAFGAGLKINFLPLKAINPYLFGEANLNLLWFEEYVSFGSSTGTYYYDDALSLGGLGGLGLDINLNENINIFIQSGMYYLWYTNYVNSYTQVGVRINLIKSKTI